jgi:hypothetical protein
MVKTPPGVAMAILDRMRLEDASSRSRARRWRRGVFASPIAKSAFFFAVAAAVVVFILRPTSSPVEQPIALERSASTDVIAQSLTNYRAVVNGDIKPQVVSSVPENVLSYFSGKTEFPVLVPAMKHCTLVGGVLSSCSGAPLAHVVYRLDDKLICMYQACWETVMKGEKLNIPDEALAELQRTGWYTKTDSAGDTVVLWRKGKTLCAAVARMDKDALLACLGADDSPAPAPW